MKVLVFLSQKSLAITEKNGTREKAEEAQEDQIEKPCIIDDEEEYQDDIGSADEDDDEDYQPDYNDRDMYESKLDEVDEVLCFRDGLV